MDQKTILIVDDSKDIIRLVADELKSKNDSYRIINANNGLNGIRIAKAELPDLILMDWDMPIMNGLEATRTLKNHDETSEIPIIMATGRMTSPEDLQMALEAGAVDYIRKPIDFIELTARMNTAMRIKAQHEAIKSLLENEIELKNRKLSTTSMLIVEKNGLLQDFFNEINQCQHLLEEESISKLGKSLKSLKKRVSNHLDIDNSWETFKIHFDEVHPDFFTNITTLAPDISHKDLKVCAYLKLGMDNKQIARLLNITPASFRTALYRLKRKMRIEEDENLRNFIVQIS